MSVKFQQWDICAFSPANDNEAWSQRKALLFVTGLSGLFWASGFLLLRLASLA